LVLLSTVSWCSAQPTQQTCMNTTHLPTTAAQLQLSGMEGFNMQLFRTVGADLPATSNAFMSAYSIWSALSLAYAGSKGETQRDFETVLGLPATRKEGNIRNTLALNNYLEKMGSGVDGRPELQTFNKGYFNTGHLTNGCLQTAIPELQTIDFSNGAQAAATINADVSAATKGLIRQLVEGGAVQDAPYVLVNALYFKGQWEEAFETRLTTERDFHDSTGANIGKPVTMAKEFGFKYGNAASLNARMVELPYKNSNMSMIILQAGNDPGTTGFASHDTFKAGPISETLNALTPENLEAELATLPHREARLTLPKFRLELETSGVIGALKKMGLQSPFSTAADFSEFTSVKTAIDSIIHKAVVDVDEEGTVAAAATGIIAVPISLRIYPKVYVNSPFVFLIYEKELKMTLFSGIVNNPGSQ